MASNATTLYQLKLEHAAQAGPSLISVGAARSFAQHSDDENNNDPNYQRLNDKQKKLVEIVREVGRTDLGQALMDEAEKNNVNIAFGNNKHVGGMEYDDRKLIEITYTPGATQAANAAQLIRIYALTWHHEGTHSFQNTQGHGNPPVGTSSYDRGLWALGHESQSFLSEEEQRRALNRADAVRDGRPISADDKPLTVAQKREMFVGLLIQHEDFYAKYYHGLIGKTRHDGEKLKFGDFAKAFGIIPGEPGNFLEGMPVHDVAELYENNGNAMSRGLLHAAHVEAEEIPLKKDHLPGNGTNTLRLDSRDKNYVIYVTRNSDVPQVTIYQKGKFPNGEGYIKIEDAKAVSSDTHVGPQFSDGPQGKAGEFHLVSWFRDQSKLATFSINIPPDGPIVVRADALADDKTHKNYEFAPYKDHKQKSPALATP